MTLGKRTEVVTKKRLDPIKAHFKRNGLVDRIVGLQRTVLRPTFGLKSKSEVQVSEKSDFCLQKAMTIFLAYLIDVLI